MGQWLGRTLAAGVAASLAVGVMIIGGTPARAADSIELSLDMTSMSVSGTKPKDKVTIRLTLRNTGTVPAYGVLAKIWRSQDPIRSRIDLTSIADGSVDTWGGWPNLPGNYQLITNSMTAFEPGATRSFTLTGTLAQLGFTTKKVAYAIGVDVVATTDQSSNSSTVAQVRTFVPMPGKAAVPVTPLVLLSAPPTKLGASLFANEDLSSQLTGRLNSLLITASSTRSSWLIDPALLDEVRDQADGYQVVHDGTISEGTGQQTAAAWLARFEKLDTARGARTLFANPDTYGAQATNTEDLLAWSKTATESVPEVTGLPLIVVPTGNVVDNANLAFLASAKATAVTASNSSVSAALQSSRSGQEVLGASSVTVQDVVGSSPSEQIQQRQLLLAETVLCSTEGQVRLLTNPDEVALNSQAEPDWVTNRSLLAVLNSDSGRQATVKDTKPDHLGVNSFERLKGLAGDLEAYQDLAPDSTVAATPQATYLRSISQSWIGNEANQDEFAMALRDQFGPDNVNDKVSLRASARFVMSGRTTEFPVTVTNDLTEPVQVRVVVVTDNPQRLTVPPSELITVQPGQSETVNIRPEATTNGVVTADAYLTDATGRRVGEAVSLTIEMTELGMVAWIIVGISGVVLVVATWWRIRQVRRRESTSAQNAEAPE
jgi:Family of unknown function (DUF6049)